MCIECDNPGIDSLALVRGIIHDYGWFVQGVEGDPPWAYTVGLCEHDRPELVLTGMPLERAAALLNAEAAYRLHFQEPVAGQRFRLRDGPAVEVVSVARPWAHLHTAVGLYGPEVSAAQLVHADDRGHWPWEPGYRSVRGVRGGQPVLGVRVAG
ncbi:hypothetical protein Lesp02_22590 [Lentzea sp. NBRC 105346]|uniref:DUF4262 domain-containing protein n=1 Tax=Lentzea sp. NBRC 105346 TaxID=3032205 RepID=UPI0024A5BFB1|nr:DUF4262 domain-containing protein [Lentzea sp. NBRC 105346]GLZ30069.1 hypothetical protein Lesp02_22590 [Lentzea sp. NBRC 105346]